LNVGSLEVVDDERLDGLELGIFEGIELESLEGKDENPIERDGADDGTCVGGSIWSIANTFRNAGLLACNREMSSEFPDWIAFEMAPYRNPRPLRN